MEAASLAFSVAQTLFAALQCSELKELFSMWGYQSELENLESTVKTIKAVLLSANSKQALTPQELDFIENLKDVVYEADDLIDEFITVALQQQHQSPEKVKALFSRLKKLPFAYKMSRKVKKIRKKLDRVGDDANKFSFKIDDQPIRKRRDETCSYVNVNDIVGREDDLKRIVDMLLDPNNQEDVSVLAIVGIGGLGKTALAQLVYRDPRIQEHFPLRLWVCVSDQDQNQFSVETILANILMSTSTCLEQLVQELRKKLDENKYLLVLDDVWTENNGDWLKLKPYLLGFRQRGNKIVVTTRSKGTAIAVNSSHTYELQCLLDEYSWRLFEMVVGSERANCHDLAEIGRDIVKKCANVPLAVKVVGSLLHGQDVNTWQSFQKSRLSEIRKDMNDIMPILEFSYRHLSPSLKSCFTYCALFPKDFQIDKEKLLDLWMAQDYVERLDGGQNIDDAAEEYFQILVRRCFFQDVDMKYGKVTFKIHDLMHDMAQQVAGKEIFVANLKEIFEANLTSTLDKKRIRHLYDDVPFLRTEDYMVRTKIRTYVMHGGENPGFPVSTLLANWGSLRALELSGLGIRSLPDTIGQLLHLRYLDLSGNEELEMVPKSLTKLINLQFLNLQGCKVKELPRDFSKLVNLRTLYVPNELEYMPLGMAKMTRLTRLNVFILGQRKSCLKQEVTLEDLRATRNVKGSLEICVCGDYKHAKEYSGEGGYICNTKHLNSIHIRWPRQEDDEERVGNDEDLLEALQPHSNLKELTIGGYNDEERVGNDEDLLEALQPHSNLKELTIEEYNGVRMPRWAREDSLTTSLPNLVEINLYCCDGLQELPWLGRLQHLKTLQLESLENMEYMENRTSIGSSSNDGVVASNSSRAVESSIFFPSLETLELYFMPKLKGWWRGTSNSTSEIVNRDSSMLTAPAHPLPSFPCLSKLTIRECPNLMSIPLCPAVETLFFDNLNERFQTIMRKRRRRVGRSSSSSNDSGNWRSHRPKIREIVTDNVGYLKSLPKEAFQCLIKMRISGDDKVESLSEVKEVFRGCSSSLRSLKLWSCKNLRSVFGGGLEYLTALEQLELSYLPKLSFDETEEKEEEGTGTGTGTGMPWRCLGQCLRSLELVGLEKVVNLPKGMRYLTALQTLGINGLPLKDLPEWIECLSSLHSLHIERCIHLESLPRALRNLTSLKEFGISDLGDKLKHRCEKPDGEYWPILERIPNFRIKIGMLELGLLGSSITESNQ